MVRRILSLAFALAVLSAPPSPAATVTLRPEAQVRSAEVLLGDVASIQTGDASLAARLKSVRLGSAPWPGYSASFSAGNVLLMLKAAGLNTAQIALAGSPSVRVSRPARTVPGQELAEAARAAVQAAWDGAERIECEVLRVPEPVKVSEGAVEIVPTPGLRPRAGVVPVTLDILVDGKRERQASVTLRVKVFSPAVTLTKAVARGQVLEAADLTLEERDLAGGAASVITDIGAAVGQRTVRPLPAGAVLRQSDLQVVPLVHRSSTVTIVACAGRVTVRSSGQALEEGVFGQVIKVRPEHSREPVSARVTGEGRVEIPL